MPVCRTVFVHAVAMRLSNLRVRTLALHPICVVRYCLLSGTAVWCWFVLACCSFVSMIPEICDALAVVFGSCILIAVRCEIVTWPGVLISIFFARATPGVQLAAVVWTRCPFYATVVCFFLPFH